MSINEIDSAPWKAHFSVTHPQAPARLSLLVTGNVFISFFIYHNNNNNNKLQYDIT